MAPGRRVAPERLEDDCFRLPPGVDLEVAHRRGARRPLAVVEIEQPAGTDECADEVELDDDVVAEVAAIHEASIGDEVFGHQTRERQLGSVGHPRAEGAETSGGDGLPPDVTGQSGLVRRTLESDQSRTRRREPTDVDVKPPKVVVEVDVEPLAAGSAGFIASQGDQASADTPATSGRGNHRVLDPCVDEAVPHDVHKPMSATPLRATTQPRLCRWMSSVQFHSLSSRTRVSKASA
jgi:hypothetical protein